MSIIILFENQFRPTDPGWSYKRKLTTVPYKLDPVREIVLVSFNGGSFHRLYVPSYDELVDGSL